MIPIHQLLNRIRWDRDFGRAVFEIGYYDRIDDRIVRVPFEEISFPTDDRSTILIIDQEGVSHSVPLHRIREVFRDRQLIWQRPVTDHGRIRG